MRSMPTRREVGQATVTGTTFATTDASAAADQSAWPGVFGARRSRRPCAGRRPPAGATTGESSRPVRAHRGVAPGDEFELVDDMIADQRGLWRGGTSTFNRTNAH